MWRNAHDTASLDVASHDAVVGSLARIAGCQYRLFLSLPERPFVRHWPFARIRWENT